MCHPKELYQLTRQFSQMPFMLHLFETSTNGNEKMYFDSLKVQLN